MNFCKTCGCVASRSECDHCKEKKAVGSNKQATNNARKELKSIMSQEYHSGIDAMEGDFVVAIMGSINHA